MIAKTMTYTDYDGNKRTETFHFNLTKAEATELETTTSGGLGEQLLRLSDQQNIPEIVKFFKEFILKAYGVKSPDGRQFQKVDEKGNPLWIGFSQTEAYSDLFMELATNADAAAEFVNGVIPKVDKPKVENQDIHALPAQ